MESNLRKIRQAEGITMAKLQQKYSGRQTGANANREKQLQKYSDVVDLLDKSDLSLKRITSISGRSVNTIKKVKELLDI